MSESKYQESVLLSAIRKHWGSIYNAAKEFNVTPSSVAQWLRRGTVSLAVAIDIEERTQGEYQAIDLVNERNKEIIRKLKSHK